MNDEATSLTAGSNTYGSTANGSSDVEQAATQEKHNSVKSIGMLGSMAIAVNSLAGPAILQLPATFQESGIIPTTTTLILVGLLSCFCCLHMANVVSKVQGNRDFDKEIEFSEPFGVFWGRKSFVITQVLFYFCTVCLNVAAIVDTAQVVDTFIGHTEHGSAGLHFDNFDLEMVYWQHGPCSRKQVKKGLCDPFDGDEEYYGNFLLTVGYIITACVFLPVCLMDLKENTWFQIFGFFTLLIISLQFCISFWMYGLELHHAPWWGTNYAKMLGVIIFNFSLVVAIPAWLHEKKTDVGVRQVVYGSTLVTTILYVFVGLFAAFAVPDVNPNLLAPLVSGAFGLPLRISASFFAFVIIGLDIPLFSVLTRYNLVNSGLCSERFANWMVVYIPWGLSWTFYQGNAIADLLSWGGVLFTSAVAFILPLALALYIYMCQPDLEGSIAVYGKLIKSRMGEKISVWILLSVAVGSVIYAIIGLL